jgi:hypothetical protein
LIQRCYRAFFWWWMVAYRRNSRHI